MRCSSIRKRLLCWPNPYPMFMVDVSTVYGMDSWFAMASERPSFQVHNRQCAVTCHIFGKNRRNDENSLQMRGPHLWSKSIKGRPEEYRP